MMTSRRLAIAALGIAGSMLFDTAARADWRDRVPVFRIGILGGELEANQLRDFACLKDRANEALGVPVELFASRDYSGVLEGLLAGEVDAAGLGAAGYAGLHLNDPDAVEPIASAEQADGTVGYFSVMYVRADSPYHTLDDLRGRSLAFTDRQSTSGFLVPNHELTEQGYEPMRFFSVLAFTGGHPQAVRSVLSGQYDAGVTWSSGIGNHEHGYSRGNLRRMVERGSLDMSEIRIIWKSSLIPAGPHVVRRELPDEAKDIYRQVLLDLADRDLACFERIVGGEAVDFEPITHDLYEDIIEIRRSLSG